LSDGQYFVLGDNRNAAKDSRSFGAVEKDLILGRAAFRGYPMDKLGVIGVVEYK
jgi:signal peptidase I